MIEYGAKVGIHALQASSLKWVQEAVNRGITWPVVKAVGDIAWLENVKKISPKTITVARVAHNINGIGEGLTGIEYVTNGDYSNYVDLLFEPVLKLIAVNPALKQTVDYWEICNEPDPPAPRGYRNMAECMVQCMAYAEYLGIKLALFALNAGTPEWEEIEAMMETDVFKNAQAGGHIISVHEGVFIDTANQKWGEVDQWYGGAIPTTDQSDPNTKWVQLKDDKFIITPNGDPSLKELPKNIYTAGPLNFRYRFWLQKLRDAGYTIPFLVSEIRLGATEHYHDRLPWYDERAAQDPELIGFLPFTWSPYSSHHWGDADMESASGVVLDYMERVKGRKNATYPEPTKPVEPDKPDMSINSVAMTVADAHPSKVGIIEQTPPPALAKSIWDNGEVLASSEIRFNHNGETYIVQIGREAGAKSYADDSYHIVNTKDYGNVWIAKKA